MPTRAIQIWSWVWNPLKPPASDTVQGRSVGRIADEITKALNGF